LDGQTHLGIGESAVFIGVKKGEDTPDLRDLLRGQLIFGNQAVFEGVVLYFHGKKGRKSLIFGKFVKW